MPRIFAKVNTVIWGDPDFRALPPAAQHLYFTLWTSPDLSFCGVHDWRPARMTGLSQGFATEHIQLVADCLAARYFVVLDEETEEALVRSWARWDETVKQPRLAISYVHAYASVASPNIRAVLVHETNKMRSLWPELACWNDQRVLEMLAHPAISAKSLPTPEDPFGDGFGDGFALGLPQTRPKVWGSVSVPPTTTTTTTTNPSVVKGGVGGEGPKPTRKRAGQLPDDWKPNEVHLGYAAENDLDIDAEAEQFIDHHRAKGSTMKDWDAAFRTWLRNAVKWRKDNPGRQAPRPARPTSVHDLEEPPNGLSPTEYAQWELEARQRAAARRGA